MIRSYLRMEMFDDEHRAVTFPAPTRAHGHIGNRVQAVTLDDATPEELRALALDLVRAADWITTAARNRMVGRRLALGEER